MKINIDELILFSEKNPGETQYPGSLKRRFLTELISSEKLIFDLHDEQGLVGLAVLLDKVNNPANDACLEILGIRKGVDPIAMTLQFIEMAKAQSSLKRAGFQINRHESSVLNDETLKALGFSHYYDTFEMLHSSLNEIFLKEDHVEILKATALDADQLYKVLCESFADNPDTSIPDEKTWKLGFLKSSSSHYYLWKTHNQILGFANLIESEDLIETEIRTIGVLPEGRRQGIGKKLLLHCLKHSSILGFKTCRLTVAVTNEKALTMYVSAGFKITEKFKCFRMNFFV